MIIYVNALAERDGNGSREMPFKHINSAAQIARAGDEVIVAPGIYREYVDPQNGGTDSTVDGVNQPRYTPYHIPHRTEVAGFMTILHGDNRFYNNIFIENWPVVDGNAYFNGAKACKNESSNLVKDESNVYVELVEADGKYSIKTNVYDFLEAFRCEIINSDILGCAFEPEERFENPDGSGIIFDQDYLGEHRGVSCLPGPFAAAPLL